MQWKDNAVVINCAKFGESSSIVTVLSQNHGVHKGMLKRGYFAQGDLVDAVWTARLSEQLGSWKLDQQYSYSSCIMRDRAKLQTLIFVGRLLCVALSERTPCPEIFWRYVQFLDALASPGAGGAWVTGYLYFELFLLTKTGFGFDFGKINPEDPYCYIDSRTGTVFTKSAGEAQACELLRCPSWLAVAMQQYRTPQINTNGAQPALENDKRLTSQPIALESNNARLTSQPIALESNSAWMTSQPIALESMDNLQRDSIADCFKLIGHFLGDMLAHEYSLLADRDKVVDYMLSKI
ncbi:MAG: recombination protein O N-terminal domain-containing protein [Holosporales bacterium]|jgi:DNA repair protein RecO (recombination protein O)|nr:recombination protein O N-terminal domain-containing protein [Holosporales bacterium]